VSAIAASPRARRVLGRAMRAPAALDRPGLRWLLNLLSPAPIVVLVHRGRRSGRLYRTPVEALVADPERGEIVVSPIWGEKSDWYRNIVAGGLVEARMQGEGYPYEWRLLGEAESLEAVSRYRHEHPVYARMILRMLVWIHDLDGEPVEAVARALPAVALRPAATGR
jgi:deazaflavin-dependent oxidoreductase (nitroreductase family)